MTPVDSERLRVLVSSVSSVVTRETRNPLQRARELDVIRSWFDEQPEYLTERLGFVRGTLFRRYLEESDITWPFHGLQAI